MVACCRVAARAYHKTQCTRIRQLGFAICRYDAERVHRDAQGSGTDRYVVEVRIQVRSDPPNPQQQSKIRQLPQAVRQAAGRSRRRELCATNEDGHENDYCNLVLRKIHGFPLSLFGRLSSSRFARVAPEILFAPRGGTPGSNQTTPRLVTIGFPVSVP